MVFPHGDKIGRGFYSGQINRRAAEREAVLLGQPVFQITLTQKKTVRLRGQAGAVGIPVEQIKRGGLFAEQVVIDNKGPDQIIGAQQVKDRRHGDAVQIARFLHGPVQRPELRLINKNAEVAGFREVQQGGEIGR